jgi:hypothetical protein
VLVGLAGELGCLAAEEREDCEAGRLPPPVPSPLVELVPVPTILIPALGEEPAQAILPRFPYGLADEVTPVLGAVSPAPAPGAWVRVALPPGAADRAGPAEARLLLRVDPAGVQVLPCADPPDPQPVERPEALPALSAEVWPGIQAGPAVRREVLLPAGLAALQVLQGAEILGEAAWPEAPPPLLEQPLATPAWSRTAEERLGPAAGACARAWIADHLRHPGRDPVLLPPALEAPLLLLWSDARGRIHGVLPLNAPWTEPEPAACLQANARLLPPVAQARSFAVLRPAPIRAPLDPPLP